MDNNIVDKLAKVLDPDRLGMLRKLESKTGRDLLGQLLNLFLEQTPVRIEQMRQGFAANDLDAVVGPAHSMKGSCVNLGVNRLGQLSSDLEEAARAGDLAMSQGLFEQVQAEYEKVSMAMGAVGVNG